MRVGLRVHMKFRVEVFAERELGGEAQGICQTEIVAAHQASCSQTAASVAMSAAATSAQPLTASL